MKIDDFKRILERISDLFGAAGATDAAKDIGHVVKALKGHDGSTVEDFVKAKAAERNSAKAGKPPKQFNDHLINEHATRLLEAGIDKTKFEVALLALKTDRNVSSLELYAVTNAYINRPSGEAHNFKFKSPKAALEKMSRIFVERMDAQSKQGTINKMSRWA